MKKKTLATFTLASAFLAASLPLTTHAAATDRNCIGAYASTLAQTTQLGVIVRSEAKDGRAFGADISGFATTCQPPE